MTANDITTIVEHLPSDRAEEAVTVLADAFFQYPVMQHMIGSVGDRYDDHLLRLLKLWGRQMDMDRWSMTGLEVSERQPLGSRGTSRRPGTR